MKKTLIYLAAFAALFTACTKELEKIENEEPVKEDVQTYTLVAGYPETKTTLSGNVFNWAPGETIAVADETTTPKVFTISSNDEERANGVFTYTGSLTGDLRLAATPASSASVPAASGSNVTIALPTDYTYVAGQTNAVMVSTAPVLAGGKYTTHFAHAMALIKVSYTNVPIGTKYFKLTMDQNIAGGSVNIDASATPEIKIADIITTPSKSVTVTLTSAVSVANTSMDFYVPVPTGTYGKFTVQLCDASDNVLSEKNRDMTAAGKSLTLGRADVFATPAINLPAAVITKGKEYTFDFGGTKKFDSWGTGVTQNSMTWTLNKVTVEKSANPGSWDGSSRGQQIGTGSSGSQVTSVLLKATDYAAFCGSSTAVGINEIHVKAGAKNGTTVTCAVSVGGVAMSAKSSGSNSYTAADTKPGTMTFTSESLLTGDIEITYTLSSAGALYINNIVINPDLRTAVTLSFASEAIGKTTENYAGFTGQTATSDPDVSAITSNIVYSKLDPSSIISSFNTSTGVLALNGTKGTATITASFDGDATYKPASKSYTITVTDADDVTGTWATWSSGSAYSISENIASSEVSADFCGTSATLAAYNSSNKKQSLVDQSSGSFHMLRFEAASSSYWKIVLPVAKAIPVGTTINISFYEAVNSKGITSWTVTCNGNTCGSAATITTNGSPSSLSDMTLVERSYTTTAAIAKDSNIEIRITAGSGTTKNVRLANVIISAE